MLPRQLTKYLASAGFLALLTCAPLAYAGGTTACTASYRPKVGQPGKNVPWIPTPEPLVKRMLSLAHVTPSDVVYDLGSGDGRVVIAAARLGAKAVGIEYNPKLVALSRCLIAAAGLSKRARIIHADLLRTNFSKASVVTLFLSPRLDARLRPKLLALKPGTRIVSNEYLIDNWSPDRRLYTRYGIVYLWYVPARVDGKWTFHHGHHRFQVTFVQEYQQVTALVGAGTLATHTSLRGSRIAFTFPVGHNAVRVTGTVQGGRIVAQVRRRGHTSRYIGTRS